MPKTTLILTLTLFLHSTLFSRTTEQFIDSLEILLEQDISNEQRLEIYYDLNLEYFDSELDRAFEYAGMLRNLAEDTGETYFYVQGILLQCDFYTHIGDYNTAFELAYEALELSANNIDLLSDCHNRIAIIHSFLGNNKQSLYHNKISLRYNEELGDSPAIMLDLHNIGADYNELRKYDSALYILRITNAYELSLTGHPDPYSLSNIGNSYLALEQFDSALFYHHLAYELDKHYGDSFDVCMDELALAESYLKSGDTQNAKRFALKAHDCMLTHRAQINMVDVYEILYTLYKQEGNYQEALQYALRYNTVKDSIHEQGKQSLILGLETKHRVKEQGAQLRLLIRQKKLYLVLATISALFLISLVVLVVIIYRRQKRYRNLLNELKQANQSKERLLSIISHDLRGSVGGLRTASKAIADNLTDPDSAIDLMGSFFPVADSIYDLLENLLIWAKCNKQEIKPVFEELNIRDLVDKSVEHTYHIAHAKSIELVNNALDVYVYTDRNMLLSVIRNLLSNAIKFSHAKSRVTINQEITNDEIIISITDEGIGMTESAVENIFKSPEEIQASGTLGERGSGLGLNICKTFLDSLESRIWVKSTPERGTTFFFTIPLTK